MKKPRNVTHHTARLAAAALSFVALLLAGCGGDAEEQPAAGGAAEGASLAEAGELVALPFSLTAAGDNLMLTYADAEGAHTVHRVSDVPEAARAWVRVDSLTLAPEQRPSDGRVFVADLSGDVPQEARLVPRAAFDAHVEQARAAGASAGGALAAAGTGDIVLYGASWCGACRQARQFFEREGVAFIDRDIERDPGAREEMNAKARAAGVATTGIPVIDVRGTILTGFDERRIRRLLAAPAAGVSPSAPGGAPAAVPQPI
jgi:glutaredoxin